MSESETSLLRDLTGPQLEMWFAQKLDPNNPLYDSGGYADIKGSIEISLFEASLRRFVDDAQILHLRFIDGIHGPAQRVETPPELAFRYIDFSAEHDPFSAAFAAMQADASKTFDIVSGPLMLHRLYKLGTHRYVWYQRYHHIVIDGVSIPLAARRVEQIYGALIAGRAVPPSGFAAVDSLLLSDERYRSSPRYASDQAYWRDYAASLPPSATMDGAPPDATGAFVRHSVHLPDTLSASLLRAEQTMGKWPQVLTAVIAAYLFRYTGGLATVFDFPVTARTKETRDTPGAFANVLPLHLPMREQDNFVELSERVGAEIFKHLKHQQYRVKDIKQMPGAPRGPIFGPRINIIAFDNAFRFGESPATLHSLANGLVNDVAVTVIGQPGQPAFELHVDGNARRYEQSEMAVHARRLLHFVEQALFDPCRAIGSVELVEGEERHRLLDEWNATEEAFPAQLCLHQLVEQQVQRTPEATAVVFGDERLSYQTLNERANRLAHYLRAHGVRPDSRVAVCAERSVGMVVALLGVLKAGGAYVPLDPSYPSERLAHILGDAEPMAVLVDRAGRSALNDALPALSNVLDIDTPQPLWNNERAANPLVDEVRVKPEHLAYVIYTSGSTGTPKGAQNEHRALVNRLLWMQRAYALKADDVVLQKTPFSFDVSVWEFFWTLSSGATLCIAPPGVHRDAERLAALIAEQRITTAHFVPSMLSSFLDAAGAAQCTSLRRIVCSGEALPAATVRRFKRLLSHVDLHNLYGPTEAAIDVTAWTCPPSFDDEIVPIGKPISNTRIYLLDAQAKPVPIGAVGELYIGGVGVARGYLNRPDLTHERFLPDPFALAAGKPYPRMYRTGDLARYLPDGNIVFVGRNDHQVKIRGLRIELGEIEAQLAQHEAVREAVVIAREGVDGEPRLVAYVTLSEQGVKANAQPQLQPESLSHQLKTHLQTKLPDYMVPAAFVRLDALPVTTNGKLDRKALPAPSDEAFAHHDYEAPQGDVEKTLASLWCELLNLDRIGRHDDFFELGGHSLLAVRLLSRLPAALAIEVPLSMLFAYPTLSAFAAAIASARTRAPARALPPITRAPRDAAIPLSFAQQRLWFLAALDGESTTYHVPVVLRLRGSLDVDAWRRAIDTVWRRHEALRTVFPVEHGQPTARLLSAEQGVPWRMHDLAPSADALLELRRICESEARAPFDLANGPLIRASLVRIADNEHVFMVVQHHIVSDGWSIRVLLGELLAHYQTSINAQIEPLPDLSIQYRDYVTWQRRWLNAERLADEARYWRETLAGAPALLALPTDRPRPPRQQFTAGHVPIALDADLTAALRRICREHGVTLFMLMVAAWAAVLARLSGQAEVVIGTPTANRPRAELEPLIGLFVNSLALRIDMQDLQDLQGQPALAALLARVRRTVLGAQEHQNLPFEQVVELVQPWRQLDHTPIFQVMIAWQEVDIRPLQSPMLRIEPVGGSFDQVKFDLELDLADDGSTVSGSLRYATALFDEPTAARHSGYLSTILRAIAEADARSPTRIPLVDADERETLIGAFNRTARSYPAELCVHELIERQAQRTPDATAIECDGQRITYAQLNARANRLAHHLVVLGVRPDRRVAVCAQRSIDLVAGLLAVLKAGGAYVPLDPGYPSARIAHVLTDAAPVALLVDATTRQTFAPLVPDSVLLLQLDDPNAAWGSSADANLRPGHLGLTPKHLTYVIYTSGSTGVPKGVMVEHRQLANLIAWHIDRFELRPGSCTTCTAGLAFDAAAWEIWPTLGSGATLLLPPSNTAGDTAALLRWWRAQPIESAFLVTPLAMLAIEAGLPPSLRRLLIGGDRFAGLPAPLPAHVQLFNNYGPTEATVVATCGLVDPLDPTPTIGRPIDNARIYLLDDSGEPVPTGAIGEIHIGGAGVARGYLNRPDLDAERFVPDPFAVATGNADARMYRTGDLARHLPDGRIVFLGRNDQQIKIRGYRIELGEIEAQLRAHEAVQDVAVVARNDEHGATQLIAYIVAHRHAGEISAVTPALRSHLQARLPEYMTPAAFMWLDALPLTSNGKIDRQALPAPSEAAFDHGAYEAPRGAIENTLADIWRRLLGLDRIGRHNNFFVLGGHSLLAAQMISEVRTAFARELSIRTLFEAPTITQLSERIENGVSSDALSVLLPLREHGHGAPLFCIHPAGGFSWPYAGLLRYLPERPLFALQARSLCGGGRPATIEAMASDYLTQIRAVQPVGPYHLLGWSLGCHIAHAIATQLQESGEYVEQLIMLDGYPIPSDAAWAAPSDQDIMQGLVHALSEAPMPPADRPMTLSAVKASLVASSDGVLSALGDGVIEAIFGEFKVAPLLAASFRPRTYRGDVLFFRAGQTDAGPTVARTPAAWQPYVDGHIETHEIDCAHEAMMRPHALAQIGPRLAAALVRETAS